MSCSSVESCSWAASFYHCGQKRERDKILKSSGQKYDAVIQRNVVTDHDVPRVPRHLNLAGPAVPAIRAPRSRRRTMRNHMETAPGIVG
jgi:hypothetical protein